MTLHDLALTVENQVRSSFGAVVRLLRRANAAQVFNPPFPKRLKWLQECAPGFGEHALHTYRYLLAKPDESTEVGAPFAVLIALFETEAHIDAALGHVAAGDPQRVSLPQTTDKVRPVDGLLDVPEAELAPVHVGNASTQSKPIVVTLSAPDAVEDHAARIFVSPIARVKAREAGLDLSAVSGSGPAGRIVRADIEAALRRPQASMNESTAPTDAAAGFTAIAHTGMRKAIARRLTESKSTVPHFYLTTDCRVDELLALRAKANENSPVKISVNDFVIKAVASAFLDVPQANVTWADSHVQQWHSVDIAVAVATDGGLLTPIVRGVEDLTLTKIAKTVAELAGRARAGRLRQEELEGGSFSVTNLGMYGTTEFSAIINPPHSGILAIGAAKQQPVVVDGQLAVATVMRCTLSADHRAVDGALAAQWLAAFTARIENPLSILV